MQIWWMNYKGDLPELNEGEKKYIEDITGRIPLLLRALPRIKCKNFKDIEEKFPNSPELLQVIKYVELSMKKQNRAMESSEWKE